MEHLRQNKPFLMPFPWRVLLEDRSSSSACCLFPLSERSNRLACFSGSLRQHGSKQRSMSKHLPVLHCSWVWTSQLRSSLENRCISCLPSLLSSTPHCSWLPLPLGEKGEQRGGETIGSWRRSSARVRCPSCSFRVRINLNSMLPMNSLLQRAQLSCSVGKKYFLPRQCSLQPPSQPGCLPRFSHRCICCGP